MKINNLKVSAHCPEKERHSSKRHQHVLVQQFQERKGKAKKQTPAGMPGDIPDASNSIKAINSMDASKSRESGTPVMAETQATQ